MYGSTGQLRRSGNCPERRRQRARSQQFWAAAQGLGPGAASPAGAGAGAGFSSGASQGSRSAKKMVSAPASGMWGWEAAHWGCNDARRAKLQWPAHWAAAPPTHISCTRQRPCRRPCQTHAHADTRARTYTQPPRQRTVLAVQRGACVWGVRHEAALGLGGLGQLVPVHLQYASTCTASGSTVMGWGGQPSGASASRP